MIFFILIKEIICVLLRNNCFNYFHVFETEIKRMSVFVGRYECLYNTTTGPHITWDRIDYIKPYPNMQVPTNKTYKCENQQVDVICCVHSDYNIQWVQNKKMLSNSKYLSEMETVIL